ncbi:MAG: hypothetical protein JSS13_08545 [Proteobacteria bacterium]|nr:hypothetical protein [Pseudomonadota bacterium]
MHIRRRNVPHVLATAIAMAIAGTAHANTYTASTEAELIQAVNNANTNAGTDTISVTADITLTAALPTITEALTIQGSGGQHTIQRDNTGTNACSPTATNAFRLIDASADLTLNDLTLSGGCNLVDQGGAVRVTGANLTLARSTISGNKIFYPDTANPCYGQCIGGGVAVLYGNADISDSVLSGNQAAQGYATTGGGVGLYHGDLSISHSTISGNLANSVGGGGGIYATGVYPNGPAGTVTIIDSTISNNAGGYGGGITLAIDAVTITDSRITGNQSNGAANPRGGGVLVQNVHNSATFRVERTLVSGNAISGDQGFGGGICVVGGTFELYDSAVVNNTVIGSTKARAGGVMLENATATIGNSTLSGNSINGPTSGGGAIMLDGDDDVVTASLDLRNSTVSGNASNNTGGGLYIKRDTPTAMAPTAMIESSIVAGNQGADGLDAIGTEASTPAAMATDHSLLQGSASVGTGTLSLDATTLSLWDQDPLLLPLAYNGGTTPTHALAPNSPAIDRGTNSQSLANDERGAPYARVVGIAADIGAYELDTDRVFANGFE